MVVDRTIVKYLFAGSILIFLLLKNPFEFYLTVLHLVGPYMQTLGISHAFSSFIWLCGPITGLVVG